jgi:hypothetical protein
MAEAARPASPAGAGLEAGWLQTIFLMLASRRLNGSSTSVPGQTEKNSVRAYVFWGTPESGHPAVQSACRKRANNGRVAKRHSITSSVVEEQFIGRGEAERLRGLEVKRMSAAPRRAQARGPGTKPRLLDLGEGFDLHEEIRVGQLRDGDRRTRRRGRAEIVLA